MADNRPTLVQRYPNDKWRWVVGGDHGGWYCELLRVPAHGPVGYSSYDRTDYMRSKKSANSVCGQLNQSLRFGGMLGSIDGE